MNHDPLCPWFTDHLGRSLHQSTEQPCHYCNLIAKVRKDEQRQRDNIDAAARNWIAAAIKGDQS
jgi:hypothetical protein